MPVLFITLFFYLLCLSAPALSAAEKPDFEKLLEQGLHSKKKINKPVDKVVVLFPQSLGLVYLFGIQKSVCAMPLSKTKISMHQGGFFDQLDREAVNKKDCGFPGKPDIELISAIKPDLIISPTFQIKADLFFERLKIPIFRVHGTFSDYEQWLSAVEKFGELFKAQQKAKEYADYFKKTVELTKADTCGVIVPKKVAHIVCSANKYIASGKKSRFVKWFLKNMGCEVFDYPQSDVAEIALAVEDLVKFDPEYVFIDSVTHASGAKKIELKEEFWKKLKAYKKNNIYFVPTDDNSCFLTSRFFMPASPLGILWAAKILYPEKFEKIDIEKETSNFYKHFFNLDYDMMIKANKNIKL